MAAPISLFLCRPQDVAIIEVYRPLYAFALSRRALRPHQTRARPSLEVWAGVPWSCGGVSAQLAPLNTPSRSLVRPRISPEPVHRAMVGQGRRNHTSPAPRVLEGALPPNPGTGLMASRSVVGLCMSGAASVMLVMAFGAFSEGGCLPSRARAAACLR